MTFHSENHMVAVPKAYWGLKIAQLVLAVIIFALSCFEAAVYGGGWPGFMIFVGLYTIGILTYYFVAVHNAPHAYNWIAFLVLECVAVVFWLVVWALLAAALAVVYYYVDYYYLAKRSSLAKRLTVGEVQAAGACIYAILALSLIEWILYIVTLVFLGRAVHRHRKNNGPMTANGPESFNMASRQEKHDMQNMPPSQTYYSPDQQQQQQPVPVPHSAEVPANRY